jgi:tRNA threonylcarbamoyladenosine biosynthesis protein TsaB
LPNILLIESATDICSVGISKGAGELASLKENAEDKSHAAVLTLLIEACAQEAGIALAELDAVAVSEGPGSYTSLRIGLSTAKGICYALGKPLIAIDTLQSLAMAAAPMLAPERELLIAPMIDARRMEVYTAVYTRQGQCVEATHAHILQENSFANYIKSGKCVVLCGNGADKAGTCLRPPGVEIVAGVLCSAQHLAPLAHQRFAEGLFEDVAYYSPNYFKPPNITRPKNPLTP